MEEDFKTRSSILEDITVNLRSQLMPDDNTSVSTAQPSHIAEILNMKIVPQYAVIHWHIETMAWMIGKITGDHCPEISFPGKEDGERHHSILACYAAYTSLKLVMDELFLDNTSYHYFGAKKTIRRFRGAVLACFDLLCKNFLIEKTWDAVVSRDSIRIAGDLAIEYISSQTDRLHFLANKDDDYTVLNVLQGQLTGTGVHDSFPKMQPSIKVTDNDVIGLSADIMKIKERILGSEAKRDIIPIVGMGGIGKTTLTRKVYMDPEIMPVFHVRSWVVVSREFSEREVLLSLLEWIAPLSSEMYEKDAQQLAEILYRRLRGWRYFIVLDDIWTIKAWNHIKLCFPDDNNGSRIILTSRITEVASYVDPDKPPHIMNFLGIEDSWDLLCKKVYGKDACPPQLKNIGIQIARKCQGLPLAIQVMAGYLSNISKTQECWEDVAKRAGFPTEVTKMESLSKILSISYDDLPHHLKACFLTIVNFPKNFEISVKKLLRVWIAMGIFLPQKLPKDLKEATAEEVAVKCLENLIDRSLIVVRKKKFDGKAKLCGIHDLLWDLSMRAFRTEGHYIFGSRALCNLDYMNDCDDDRKYLVSISKTLLYFDQTFESDCPLNSKGFKQLRVLDILNQSFDYFPVEIISLVNLRYLALATSDSIPYFIWKLYNLEILLNYHEKGCQMLPKSMWLLPRLRHLHVGTSIYLPKPDFARSCGALLPNLRSLSNLRCSSCTEEVFCNIPNLKQLGIIECEEDDINDRLLRRALGSLVNLHNLETLKFCCNGELLRRRSIPKWSSFLPNTIKKLTLSGCFLPWKAINDLAILPNLEVLKVKQFAFQGQEWEVEDEFPKLKYLMLDTIDLVFWKAESENFPNLQCLRLRACHLLCRIPMEFGEICTLELIDLDFCSPMACEAAIRIQREQTNMGNDKLILQLGRVPPMVQIIGYAMVFIWMAMRLNIVKPESDCQEKKLRKGFHLKKGMNPLKLCRRVSKKVKIGKNTAQEGEVIAEAQSNDESKFDSKKFGRFMCLNWSIILFGVIGFILFLKLINRS